MASTPPEPIPAQGPPSARKLAESARLTWLKSRMAGHPESETILSRAIDLEAALGRALWALRQPNMTLTGRANAAAEMVRLRSELDALVASAGAPASTRGPASGPPALRERLAYLLDVPLTAPFDGLIDAKIAEHHEQLGAFDHVAALFGFRRAHALGQNEPRGALVLTTNASIVQLSAPRREGDIEVRRFVYQGIYGARVPSEGRLILTDSLRVGQPLRSAAFTTSPICELRLPEGAAPWEAERKLSTTLERMFGAAAQLRATAWGADPRWVPSVVLAKPAEPRENLGVTARVQLVSALGRLQRAADPVLEAEVLGLCIYLQHLAVEGGKGGVELARVKCFTGASGDRCTLNERSGRRVLTLERPGHGRLELLDVTVGDQLFVLGTPIALLDGKGTIAAVIGDVTSIEPR